MKESFSEQKRSRRWGVVFKLLTFAYLFIGLYLFIDFSAGKGKKGADEPHTGLVQVHGMIAADQDANANAIVTGLRRAFENEMSQAVIIHINSPGGSPVQAGYVYDEIKRLRGIYPNKLVYAVISELGASGGYYIAAAADHIYADKASLVGSIGVTASSFGFTETMEKLGVERRHFTAGEHKAFLDPFSPLKQDEKAFWQQVLDKTHQQFIDVVKQGRGERLVSHADDTLFSGLIWNGEQALELGLIDGLGSAGKVARDIIKAEDIVNYTVQPSPLDAFTKKLGLALGQGISQQLVHSQYSLQ
ncbi:signal peptide peptidase SppA [Motilimonas eburnea]|nr:signal peptide peptidase SppA [Motilimonas eburnea]MCE2570477.1 signal peptide peptidase SppA [Motilimonas eburnea]